MTLSALVKQCREDQGLTIQDAQELMGGPFGGAVLYMVETRADRNPSRQMLRALVLRLGMSPAEVLGICPECGIDVEGEGEHRMDCMTGAAERREERER